MAKYDVLVHLDMNNNQILNMAVQNLPTAPSTTGLTTGFIYYNTNLNKPFMWSGSVWLDLMEMYEHPTFAGTVQPTTALTGANVISQITLNNGHVTGVQTRPLTASDIGASPTSHTHLFSQITGLPANTILANNTGGTSTAKAITVGDMLIMLGIAYGELSQLTTGTDTAQRTWTANDISTYITNRLSDYIVSVDLGYTASPTNGVITNTGGANATIPSATSTNAGLMLPAEKTKLSGIADGANNYVHPTDNPGTHPFVTELTTGLQILSQMVVNNEGHVVTIKGRNLTAADIASVMIDDNINNGTITTWSSTKIVQTLEDAITSGITGALVYKGEYNPVTNDPDITGDTTIKTGYTYVVSTTGNFLTHEVEAGDMIIAKTDNPSTTGSNWQVVNKNIPAIVDASTLVKGIIQLATTAEGIAGTNNTKAVTPAVLKAVMDARVGGYSTTFGNGTNTSFVITHNLNTDDVNVSIQRVSNKQYVLMQVEATTLNTVTVSCNVAPTTNEYKVIIKK